MSEHKKKNPENKPEEDQSLPKRDNPSPDSTPESEPQQQQTMVALTMEEYDALQNQIEEARSKEKEYIDSWQGNKLTINEFYAFNPCRAF